MRFLFLPLSLFIISNAVFGQCPDSIHLSRQSQIDSFFTIYPDCIYANNISIEGDSITNLLGLTGLKAVHDLIIIDNPLLSTLKGLDSLSRVGFTLTIRSNDILENFHGLEALRGDIAYLNIINNGRVKNLKEFQNLTDALKIVVQSNDSLLTLDGFQNLKGKFAISISGNARLQNLHGLENLEDMWLVTISSTNLPDLHELSNLKNCDYLRISYNSKLTDLTGLEQLRAAVNKVAITDNPKLQSLEGLNALERSGDMIIESNPRLKNLHGLNRLKSIIYYNSYSIGVLKILSNDSLESLAGLDSLEYVSSFMRIDYNDRLSDCAISVVCDRLISETSFIDIWNNAAGCDNKEEVLSDCGINYNYVKGKLFIDLNCNQRQDSLEPGLTQHMILSTTGLLPYTSTSSSGDFYNYILYDTFAIKPGNLAHFTFYPEEYVINTDSANFVFDSLDFAFCPDTFYHDLAVSIIGYSPPRPGFYTEYQVCIDNNGLFTEDAILVLDFSNFSGSEYVTVASAQGNPIISGNILTWHINSIPLFSSFCYSVIVQLDPFAPLGTDLTPHVSVHSQGMITELTLENNQRTYVHVVVGSYDPNDKSVDHDVVDFSDQEAPLEYTIRFQNTGTYTATFIEVLDTLEQGLNIRSFEMIATSHPYTISFPDTNVIKWRFENIYLPDSTNNEILSHGFIRFKINARGFLHANSKIHNSAAIYFDFNTPVFTNSTSTLIDLQIKTNDPAAVVDNILVYPNPTNGSTQLAFTLKERLKGKIEIFNFHGISVLMEDFGFLQAGANNLALNLTSLPNGIYFIRLLTEHGIGLKKVIVMR